MQNICVQFAGEDAGDTVSVCIEESDHMDCDPTLVIKEQAVTRGRTYEVHTIDLGRATVPVLQSIINDLEILLNFLKMNEPN